MPDVPNIELLEKQLAQAPISQIANLVIRDWKTLITSGLDAVPYLSAMRTLSDMSSSYGLDSAEEIVLRFLTNARNWRGPVARVVKAELNKRVKGA